MLGHLGTSAGCERCVNGLLVPLALQQGAWEKPCSQTAWARRVLAAQSRGDVCAEGSSLL